MKPQEHDFDKVLEQTFECSVHIPQEQVATAWNQVVREVTETAASRREVGMPLVQPYRRWRRPVLIVAAVVVSVFVAIVAPRVPRTIAFLESGNSQRKIGYGEVIQSDGRGGLMVVLTDASRVEMHSNTSLSLEKAPDGIRIELREGGVIVDAAKQRAGHLYVRTKDLTASVIGTVFFVTAGAEGSRVAVIEGEVHVTQGLVEKRLRPGEQVTTAPSMVSPNVPEVISWSRSAKSYTELLRRSAETTDASKFDLISIRPESEHSGIRGARVRCNGVDGVFPLPPRGASSPSVVEAAAVPRGQCLGRYVPLITILATAYGVLESNVSGGPDWVRSASETFQIEAKTKAFDTATKEQLRQMLQKLLTDRFKLKVRHESKEGIGYALTLGSKALLLPEASGEDDLYLEQNGRRNQINLLRGGEIVVKGRATLQSFANYLAVAPMINLNHVVDRTGLAGLYEFSLRLTMIPPAGERGGSRGIGAPSQPRIEWDPPIAKAVEDQLGLRLVSQTVSEDVIVIEHVERFSTN